MITQRWIKRSVWLLIALVVSGPWKSETGTKLVPECYFVFFGKLLKHDVTTFGEIAVLVSTGFADYGAVLVKCSTWSKARKEEGVVSSRKEDTACFVKIEGVGVRTVSLGASSISMSAAASKVFPLVVWPCLLLVLCWLVCAAGIRSIDRWN